MSTINLIVGGVDVSDFVEAETYSCIRKDIIPKSFTRYDGVVIAPRSGYKYQVDVTLSLPEKKAAALAAALDNDSISVTFTDLLSKADGMVSTALFDRPENIGGSISAETDDGDEWEIELSLTSHLQSVSGSL